MQTIGPQAVALCLRAALTSTLMIFLAPTVSLPLFAFIPTLILIAHLLGRRIRARATILSQRLAEATYALQELGRGWTTVVNLREARWATRILKQKLDSVVTAFLSAMRGQVVSQQTSMGSGDGPEAEVPVAYLGAEPFIWSGTVLENVRLGSEVSRPLVMTAVAQVGLDEGVVECDATVLSAGEKQKIVIARALVRKPRILILDEATSAIDVTRETQLLVTLRRAYPEMIVIFITHRYVGLSQCDRVIVLNKGIVVELGSYEELQEKRGSYLMH